VLSAGSAAIAPYTDDGGRFPLEASQVVCQPTAE